MTPCVSRPLAINLWAELHSSPSLFLWRLSEHLVMQHMIIGMWMLFKSTLFTAFVSGRFAGHFLDFLLIIHGELIEPPCGWFPGYFWAQWQCWAGSRWGSRCKMVPKNIYIYIFWWMHVFGKSFNTSIAKRLSRLIAGVYQVCRIYVFNCYTLAKSCKGSVFFNKLRDNIYGSWNWMELNL